MADCIDIILKHHEDKDVVNSLSSKLFVSKALLKLMHELESDPKSNLLKVRNCLVLLINLFFKIETPDHYQMKGKSSRELSNDEKNAYFNLLKEEFNS